MSHPSVSAAMLEKVSITAAPASIIPNADFLPVDRHGASSTQSNSSLPAEKAPAQRLDILLAQIPNEPKYNIGRYVEPSKYLSADHPDQHLRGPPGLAPETQAEADVVERMTNILKSISKRTRTVFVEVGFDFAQPPSQPLPKDKKRTREPSPWVRQFTWISAAQSPGSRQSLAQNTGEEATSIGHGQQGEENAKWTEPCRMTDIGALPFRLPFVPLSEQGVPSKRGTAELVPETRHTERRHSTGIPDSIQHEVVNSPAF
ncbi:hypothetical protein S40293_10789 [Stachybotrys chartarum IBT 40293]|nr:hypothetical protein S40293_10789 [Stachybotrys chartarum IBT 40293]